MSERILIVRLSALGDVVHVLPCLAALRQHFPAATIGWLVEDRAASLLEGHPQLDHLHVVPRRGIAQLARRVRLWSAYQELRPVLEEVRRIGYGVALDFQSNFRSGFLTYSSGARQRILQQRTFAKEGASRLFATEAPRLVPPSAHKIERNMTLVEALGVPADPIPRPVLAEPEAARLLGQRFREERGPRVLIQPGVSAFGALKAWPEERFSQLGEQLAAEGVHVAYVYGPGEEPLARRITKRAAGTQMAPPTGSLLELAALLKNADLFVGVDSGPLHLAAAMGTPVLGLYGPKHPGTYGPYWPESQVVRSGLECSPCRYRRCPRPDATVQQTPEGALRISPCMERLEVGLALAAARELLRAGGQPGEQ